MKIEWTWHEIKSSHHEIKVNEIRWFEIKWIYWMYEVASTWNKNENAMQWNEIEWNETGE